MDVNGPRGGTGFYGVTFSHAPLLDRGPISALRGLERAPRVPDATSPGGAPDVSDRLPFNAILRITGPNLPVELMSFDIED